MDCRLCCVHPSLLFCSSGLSIEDRKGGSFQAGSASAPLNVLKGHNAHDALGGCEATIHYPRALSPTRRAFTLGRASANRDKSHVQPAMEQFAPMSSWAFGGVVLPQGIQSLSVWSCATEIPISAFLDV